MGTQTAAPFVLDLRVYYEDTDAGGVVYYANYLKYMERARTEYLRSMGFEQDELMAQSGVMFVARAAQVDYHRPARFNDQLQVTAQVSWVKRASLEFEQAVLRAGETEPLCTGRVRIASVQSDGLKVTSIPHAIKEKLLS